MHVSTAKDAENLGGETVCAENKIEKRIWSVGGLLGAVRKQSTELADGKVQRRSYTKRTGVQMWESQLRKGSLSLAVLASLWEGQLYSAEIRCLLEQTGGFVVIEGVIHPILRRLRKERLVDSELVEPEVGHPRRYFRLTASGRRYVLELSRIWNEFSGGMNRMLSPSNGQTFGGSPSS
jgi:PadR family transcriptional regulator PadR